MERVIVKLTEKPPTGHLPEEVERIARKFDASLVPVDPAAKDDVLGTYFYADVDEDKLDTGLLDEMRSCASVDGAYLKPAGEPPTQNA